MKKTLTAIALNPLSYVLGFGFLGAVSIVSGVCFLFGMGWALIAGGVFSLLASVFITKGMTNG